MKFVLRDDDINYHYQAFQLEKWYSGIVDVCPISICIPAFIKGDFFHWCNIFESHAQYDIKDWIKDDKIYKIGDNKELVVYLKKLIAEKKAAISMHGISHRNDDFDIDEVDGNYVKRAEFFTNRDYTKELSEAKQYLNNLFGIKINSFSPPQNMINEIGLNAVVANDLSLCVDVMRYRNVTDFIKTYGFINSLKLYINRIITNQMYPYSFKHKVGFVFHKRLQPQLDISDIKRSFDFVYKKDGVFVLSTHSYGFDEQMTKHENMTMKDALMDILEYVRRHDNVEFTTLHDLFK